MYQLNFTGADLLSPLEKHTLVSDSICGAIRDRYGQDAAVAHVAMQLLAIIGTQPMPIVGEDVLIAFSTLDGTNVEIEVRSCRNGFMGTEERFDIECKKFAEKHGYDL